MADRSDRSAKGATDHANPLRHKNQTGPDHGAGCVFRIAEQPAVRRPKGVSPLTEGLSPLLGLSDSLRDGLIHNPAALVHGHALVIRLSQPDSDFRGQIVAFLRK